MSRTFLLAWTLLICSGAWARAGDPATQPFQLPPVLDEKAPGADGNLFSQATADAKKKVDAAEAAVTNVMEKSPAYLAAKLEVAVQTKKMDDAKKNGDVQERIDSMRDLTAARKKLTAMLKEKLEQNADYATAKKEYDSLMAVSKAQGGADGSDAKPTDRDPDTAKDSRIAIASRTFMVGMTLQECSRAAGATPQTITTEGNVKRCTWTVRGVVGTHYVTETEHSALGNHSHTTPVKEFGVVGYVHATFVDGKLAAFEKHNRYDQ